MNHIPESPVAIVGSRDFPDLEMVRAFVRSLPKDACVVSGGARGVDQAAESEALERGLEIYSFRPEPWGTSARGFVIVRYHYIDGDWTFKALPGAWNRFSPAAHTRNSMIVNECVAYRGSLTAFWTGQIENSGTHSVIEKAKAAGILFAVYTPDSVPPST